MKTPDPLLRLLIVWVLTIIAVAALGVWLVGCDAYAPDARHPTMVGPHHRPDTSRHIVPAPDA